MDSETFLQGISNVDRTSFKSEEDRSTAYLAARRMVARLESPQEAFWRRGWQEPMDAVIITLAIDMGIFTTMAKMGDSPFTPTQMAEAINQPQNLAIIERILKHFGANEIISETGPGTYKSTDISRSLAIPEIAAGNHWIFSILLPVVYPLPELYKKEGRLPSGSTDTVAHFATGGSFWEWMGARPHVSKEFGIVMTGYAMNKPSVLALYPLEKMYENYDGGILCVDIGSGIGHDMVKYLETHPDQKGKFIIQDQEHVISAIPPGLPSSIEAMAHDFFTPQPVKGAKAYFMKMIMHDWDDDGCRRILEQIKPAMKPGYSKLLIGEMVIPEAKAHPQATALDLMLMTMAGAVERTEAAWHKLLGSAGFKIVKIWSSSRTLDSIIECDLKE